MKEHSLQRDPGWAVKITVSDTQQAPEKPWC